MAFLPSEPAYREAAARSFAASGFYGRQRIRFKWLLLSLVFLALATPVAAQRPEDVERGLQLKRDAEALKMMSVIFAAAAPAFDEDIQGRNAPFNAAAAAKYCAEYTLRALYAPKMRREFNAVAANLAYDTVAEAADAAELFAEMTAMAPDVERAENLAAIAGTYYSIADTFDDELRPGDDAKQGGQRLLRAMHAADRITDNPVIGPQQVYVDGTDAGNVLLTFVSPDRRLEEKRELPPAAALRLLAEVSRVLHDLSAASDRQHQ